MPETLRIPSTPSSRCRRRLRSLVVVAAMFLGTVSTTQALSSPLSTTTSTTATPTTTKATITPVSSSSSSSSSSSHTTNETGVRPTLLPACYSHQEAEKAGMDIRVASPQKGLGAFATQKIPFGTYVGEYYGEFLSQSQVQARFWGSRTPDPDDAEWIASRHDRGQEVTGSYVLEIHDGTFIDAEDGDISSWCRFMNHAPKDSKDCNVKLFDQLTIGGDMLRVPQFYAIRDIDVGEELSWDYGPIFFQSKNQKDHVYFQAE